MDKIRLLILGCILFGFYVFLFATYQAKAHSWYPQDCCSEQDCAPASSMFFDNKTGDLIFTSKHGTGILKWVDRKKIRPSEDDQWHVCLLNPQMGGGDHYEITPPADPNAPMIVHCVFAPTGS